MSHATKLDQTLFTKTKAEIIGYYITKISNLAGLESFRQKFRNLRFSRIVDRNSFGEVPLRVSTFKGLVKNFLKITSAEKFPRAHWLILISGQTHEFIIYGDASKT